MNCTPRPADVRGRLGPKAASGQNAANSFFQSQRRSATTPLRAGEHTVVIGWLIWVLALNLVSAADDFLATGFDHPPASVQPWAYWWWLDSYATREGITRDLEEMKRQGISGVLLFDAGEGGPDAPKGPLFMSAPWRELFQHAIREADRLQLEVGVNVCSGWDAGGTWVTPEQAAKELVWSETRVQGPAEIDTTLLLPRVRDGFYRDVVILAFPENPKETKLEIDFFSAQALDLQFAETAQKLIADAGPLAGKTLKYLHDDSYEVVSADGVQPTWTPGFPAEFRARRGYDPLPYLALLTGRIVDIGVRRHQ